jgi:hypothetical protein
MIISKDTITQKPNNKIIKKRNKGITFNFFSNLEELLRKIKHFFERLSLKSVKQKKLNSTIGYFYQILEENSQRTDFIQKYNMSYTLRLQFKEFLDKHLKNDIMDINIIREKGQYSIKNERNRNNVKKEVIFDNLMGKSVKLYKISWGKDIPSVVLKINNEQTFQNEINIIKTLTTDFIDTKKTPHIMMYLKDYEKPSIGIEDRNDMLKKFRERNSTFESGDIDDFKGLVSEYADLGDLKKYLSSATISDELFRQIFFQILYTLSIIYEKYPNFYQGDFKIDNILVCSIIDDRKKYIKYEIMKKTYYLPCSGFQLRLWDFDKCDLGTEKGESGINKDIDLFVRSLLDEFEDSLRGDTKDFIGEIASRDNITPYGFEEYNERRNLETLLEIIWNESSFFKPFLKEPEEGEEITEQYNSDIILSKIIQKPKVVENYF